MPRRPPLPLWLQTPRGELRGETRLLERFRMSFELAAPLRPGDAADFRLVLPDGAQPDLGGEVRGTLRILRIVDAFPGAPSMFSAEIVSVRREDQAVLELWLSNHNHAGRRRFEAISGSEEPDLELSDPGVTDAFDPRDLPGADDTQTGSSAPYGFSSASRDPSLRIAGREAIRSALRRGLDARRRPGRHGGRSQRWVNHSRELAEAQARRWLSGQHDANSSVALPPAVEPTVSLDRSADALSVTVRWRTDAGFKKSWRMHLRGGGLFIAVTEPVVAQTELTLHLELPSGRSLDCQAQVVAPMPTGLGLSVHLAPDQRQALEAEAG